MITRAIVLAAGRGSRLGGVFQDPKCLIPVGGIPLIYRYISNFMAAGIQEIVLVLGYRMSAVTDYIETLSLNASVHLIENRQFMRGSILSLWSAKDWLKGDILLMDGDVYFENEFVVNTVTSKKEDFFLIDSSAQNDGEAVMVGFKGDKAVDLSRGLRGDYDLMGEWAGGLRLSSDASDLLKEIVCREVARNNMDEGYEFVVPQLFGLINVSYELVDPFDWVEIDFPEDIERAERMARKRNSSGDRV